MGLLDKTKNRRNGRRQVLDVKLRAQQARAVRARWITASLGVCLGTGVLLFLIWHGGGWAIDQVVFRNSAFAIHKIEVQTGGHVSKEQICKWGGIRLGGNLLALELARIKRDLELAPWVREAALERVLPHTLRVRVLEREPVARVSTWHILPGKPGYQESVHYLDCDGFVMLAPETMPGGVRWPEAYPGLPGMFGVSSDELRPGRRITSEHARAGVRLVHSIKRCGIADLPKIASIDVTSPGVLHVTLAGQGQVVFGLKDFERQFQRWRSILDHGQKLGRQVESLDLSVSNNLPVIWADKQSDPEAGIDPETLPPFQPRKKNV